MTNDGPPICAGEIEKEPWEEDESGLLREDPPEQTPYDLEERTALFAIRVRDLCLKLPKNLVNI